MRNPHDVYVRLLLDQILSGYGTVEQEYAIPPRVSLSADVLFVPGDSATEDAVPLGAMEPIVQTPCLLEPYSRAPQEAHLHTVLRKVLEVQQQARRRAATPAQKRLRDAIAWMLCAGRPRSLLRDPQVVPLEDAPEGFYRMSRLIPVRIVVLRDLPDDEATLLLRLLGRHRVQAQATRSLRVQARTDPRYEPILQTMVEYRQRIRTNPNLSAEQLMVDLTEVKKYLAALEKKGLKKGLKKGIEKGIEKGIAPLVQMCVRRLGRPMTRGEEATLGVRLDTVGPERLAEVVLDSDAEALAAWLADPNAR